MHAACSNRSRKSSSECAPQFFRQIGNAFINAVAKIEDAPDGRSTVATQVVALTAEGSVLGTLPYMSPEQVEGHHADARSDIFAFGVVLYELIAGTRPFTGKTQANLIASILTFSGAWLIGRELRVRLPAPVLTP